MTPLELISLCLRANPDPSCPAAAAPAGQIALDPNAPTLLPTMIGISSACCALVLIGISIRVFTRVHLIRSFVLEDYLIILAATFFYGFIAAVFSSAPAGLGKSTWNVSIANMLVFFKHQYAAQIIYILHSYCARLAAVLQIKRIFAPANVTRNFIFWASWALIVFWSCAYISLLFVCIFPCIPVRSVWTLGVSGKCLGVMIPGILVGASNLAADIVVLCLPIIGVVGLQMQKKRKIAVAAVFAMGGFACTASAVRLHYTIQTKLAEDYTFWIVVQAVCAIVEAAAVMLCCCFPVFPRFWIWVQQKFSNQKKRLGGSYGSSRAKLEVYALSGKSGQSGSEEVSKKESLMGTRTESEERFVRDARRCSRCKPMP